MSLKKTQSHSEVRKMNNTLNIAWLYPDLLNLHGDRGNLMAFEKVGSKMGLDVKINRVDTFSEEIDFDNSDIIFLNVGEIRTVAPIVNNIKKFGDKIYKFAESNKPIIAIGTAGAILGKTLERCSGEKIEGLGLLDINAVERKVIYGDDLHFTLNDEDKTEIVAVQIHLVDFFNESEESALGKIVYGKGNNDNDSTEGAKKNNVIFTNALGPVFVKNPWYAEKIINEALVATGREAKKKIEKDFYDIELKSAEKIKEFIKKKTEN